MYKIPKSTKSYSKDSIEYISSNFEHTCNSDRRGSANPCNIPDISLTARHHSSAQMHNQSREHKIAHLL